jgi:hypothetical protein
MITKWFAKLRGKRASTCDTVSDTDRKKAELTEREREAERQIKLLERTARALSGGRR